MTVLEELEQIDDDCDKHGIQFVKIDDARTAEEFGIDSVCLILSQRSSILILISKHFNPDSGYSLFRKRDTQHI